MECTPGADLDCGHGLIALPLRIPSKRYLGGGVAIDKAAVAPLVCPPLRASWEPPQGGGEAAAMNFIVPSLSWRNHAVVALEADARTKGILEAGAGAGHCRAIVNV